MSQIAYLLLQGDTVEGFQPSVGSRVTPVGNKVYVLGDSLNISTAASNNTITASLSSEITITSAVIGSLTISGNTISAPINTDIALSPSVVGRIDIPYATPLSVPLTDSSSQIVSSDPLLDGELLIGSTGTMPVAANLTAGAGITITNGPGSITIDAVAGGSGGQVQWYTNTWNGSGNRDYTAEPNSGYFANSSIGTAAGNTAYIYYCPLSPIRYTFSPSNEWSVGDFVWFTNRNIGNFSAQLLADQGYLYTGYTGSTNTPRYGGCISSGYDDKAQKNDARRYSGNYGVVLIVYAGTVNISTNNQTTTSTPIYDTRENVFILINSMGQPSLCNTVCFQ